MMCQKEAITLRFLMDLLYYLGLCFPYLRKNLYLFLDYLVPDYQATGAAMGVSTAQNVTTTLDSFLGAGLTAVWVGLLGLSLITTGLFYSLLEVFFDCLSSKNLA